MQAPTPALQPLYTPAIPPADGTALRRFLRGATYLVRGGRFLWHHTDLWGWAALPFFLTAWMITGALLATLTWTDDLVAVFLPEPPIEAFVQHWLWQSLVVSAMLALFLLAALLLWVLGNLLASPFYDVLAERLERRVLGRVDADFDWKVALGDAALSIRHSLLALSMYVSVMIPLFLLNLVPGVGTVAYTVLSWVATVFFVARELLDIPLSRRRTPFRRKIRFLLTNKALFGGLAAATALGLAIPGANLLVMPVGVIGASLLYCHLDLDGRGVDTLAP